LGKYEDYVIRQWEIKVNVILSYYRESLKTCEFDMSLKKQPYFMLGEKKKELAI